MSSLIDKLKALLAAEEQEQEAPAPETPPANAQSTQEAPPAPEVKETPAPAAEPLTADDVRKLINEAVAAKPTQHAIQPPRTAPQAPKNPWDILEGKTPKEIMDMVKNEPDKVNKAFAGLTVDDLPKA